MPTTKSLVQMHDVALVYGEGENGLLALEHFNLEIRTGEFIALVGPSGCGKSTVLKLVSGLRRAQQGGVIVANREVTEPLKIVGMAFQSPALLPWRTVMSNTMLPMEIVEPHCRSFKRDIASHKERAEQLFRSVGLKDVAERYPWQLSGGMQQRASLCRALIHQPQLLLLDEPFGALDAFTREELWDTLKALWSEKKFTVVMVTHDLAEAVYLADTVHVFSQRPGRIIHSRRIPKECRRRREDRYTSLFSDEVARLRQYISHSQESCS
ncbi:MAG: ABC transporter ATP-binding protein [Advenella sp.]